MLRKNELCTALGSVPSYTSTIQCFDSKTISIRFKINNKSNVYFQNPVKAITLFFQNPLHPHSSSFEGYPLMVRHKQDWGLYCLDQMPGSDQMLAMMSLSQHRVSSSKTVRPRAPCGARCIGHAVSTWSAVCSEAPHSQFGEGARPHLCMDEWNRPTPVRRRLSLIQAARGKPIPTGLAPVSGTKARSLEAFLQYFVFHL